MVAPHYRLFFILVYSLSLGQQANEKPFDFFSQYLASLYNTDRPTDRLAVSIMLHYDILWYVLEWISSSVVLVFFFFCLFVFIFFLTATHLIVMSCGISVTLTLNCFGLAWLGLTWIATLDNTVSAYHYAKNHFKSKKKKKNWKRYASRKEIFSKEK